jgi:hypothetical protein
MRDAFTGHKLDNLDERAVQLGWVGNRLNAERMTTHRFLRVQALTTTVTLRQLCQRGRGVASPAQNCDHREGKKHRSRLTATGLPELIAKSLGASPSRWSSCRVSFCIFESLIKWNICFFFSLRFSGIMCNGGHKETSYLSFGLSTIEASSIARRHSYSWEGLFRHKDSENIFAQPYMGDQYMSNSLICYVEKEKNVESYQCCCSRSLQENGRSQILGGDALLSCFIVFQFWIHLFSTYLVI